MVETSKSSPLSISSEAQKKLLFVRVEKKIPKEQRLRVRSTANDALGLLAFDMHFDEEASDKDGIYQIGPLELVLDNDTARYLVGSTLDIGADGDFQFNHFETDTEYTPGDKIVYN